MRVAEAGPWWDQASMPKPEASEAIEIELAEAELSEAGGLRVVLQKRARSLLADEGMPVTRSTVAVRARALLHELRSVTA